MVGLLVKTSTDQQDILEVREQLQLVGFDSFVQPKDVDNETQLQVLAGPFKQEESAKISQDKLNAAGFNTSLVAL